MSNTPSVVIFDMDGVLCRYHFQKRLARLSEMTGVAAEFIDEVIWKQGFDEQGDAGRYTAAEYHRLFCERIGAALTREQWLEARAISIEPDRQVLDMARRVKRNAVIALLTNNGPLLEESIAQVFPEVAEIFGAQAHFSCEFGVCKPDPRVFLRLLDGLRIKPGEALFIDDTETYIKGATAAGLLTHHFRSAPQLRLELEEHELLS
ncbi:MAG: HAD-IA family hydrolase [Gammaproteobacteria bacterium]|nr:MAG: HAD-IA family hydrolase [Gammaproteobacteria bacterium]